MYVHYVYLNFLLIDEEKSNFLKEITGQICTQALHLPMSMQTSMAKMQVQLEEKNISVLGNHCILHMLLQTIRRKLVKLNENAHAYWIEIASFLEGKESLLINYIFMTYSYYMTFLISTGFMMNCPRSIFSTLAMNRY